MIREPMMEFPRPNSALNPKSESLFLDEKVRHLSAWDEWRDAVKYANLRTRLNRSSYEFWAFAVEHEACVAGASNTLLALLTSEDHPGGHDTLCGSYSTDRNCHSLVASPRSQRLLNMIEAETSGCKVKNVVRLRCARDE